MSTQRRLLASLALLTGAAYLVDDTYVPAHDWGFSWRQRFICCGALYLMLFLCYVYNYSHLALRSARVVTTGARVVVDYRRNLKGVLREAPERRELLREFNQRTAERLFQLCFQNGGIYTKFGQQIATFNHGLPKEFTETLAQLQDQAKPVSFDRVKKTIEQEFQRSWQELFRHIEQTPIAAASLAQVHEAIDHKGRRVAVKVQYPQLAMQMTADLKVIRWGFQATEFFFPDVQIQWLFPEFEQALTSELDFNQEKLNSRRIAAMLKHLPEVHVPIVYDDLSTKKVLTMEFIDAPKISQVDSIRALGLDTEKVAKVLCEVFGEMVFCHGFVHCDPHPGNLFVRRNPDPKAPLKEQIVLLDHGLYRELDEDFRKTYCDLWRAMLLRDSRLLEECGQRLNVGEFAKYLPLLFTYRTIKNQTPIATSMTESEREELSKDLKKLQFSNVTDFLEQLPRDMLFVFRTNNMIRSLNKDLGGSTRERFSIMGKYAVQGHSLYSGHAMEEHNWTLLEQCQYWIDHLSLLFHLRVLDWLFGVMQFFKGEQVAQLKASG